LDFRIRQLQCFLTLSDLLNYGKTARALYTSQPTISFQIKSLEEAFGAKLFIRNRQQVRLTDAGVAFRQYAHSIMGQVHAAHECLSSLHTRLRLRVSCGPVGQFVLLPAVLRSLAAKYPEFELEVIELNTEQMMAYIQEGKVDALLMVGALPISGIRFDPLYEDGLVAVIARNSTLAQEPSIPVEVFRETPVIASRLKDCRFHQPFLHSLLAPFGITPKIVESPHSCTVQFAYASAGEGIALTTRLMQSCSFPGVVTRPFSEELPALQLGFSAMDSNDSKALSIFRRVVLDCAATAFSRCETLMQPRSPNAAPSPIVVFPAQREAS
jgi:DNA-binding transcriptional LysR family regulator